MKIDRKDPRWFELYKVVLGGLCADPNVVDDLAPHALKIADAAYEKMITVDRDEGEFEALFADVETPGPFDALMDAAGEMAAEQDAAAAKNDYAYMCWVDALRPMKRTQKVLGMLADLWRAKEESGR